MLCEIVFQYYSPLLASNYVATNGTDPANPVNLYMAPATPSQPLLSEADELAQTILSAFNAEPVSVRTRAWLCKWPRSAGVAHEVGTLRTAGDGTGVVDQNLKFLAYDNLYACDNSVFPVPRRRTRA